MPEETPTGPSKGPGPARTNPITPQNTIARPYDADESQLDGLRQELLSEWADRLQAQLADRRDRKAAEAAARAEFARRRAAGLQARHARKPRRPGSTGYPD